MKHIRLLVLTEDLPQASLTLAETESFHADTRPPGEARLAEAPGRGYGEGFRSARSRRDKIRKLIPSSRNPELREVRVVSEPELARIDDWLGKIWSECSRYEEQLHRLDGEDRPVKEQEAALANFADLDIDLGMLRSKTRFLDFYVGIVPRENVRQLEGAVNLADHLLYPYTTSGDNAHVVIVGPTGAKEAQLTSVLNAAGFQHLPIPEELDREPGSKRAELAARGEAMAETEAAVMTVNEISTGMGLAILGVGIPTGLSTIGAGIAVAPIVAASLAAITERPEILGRTPIYLGLTEGYRQVPGRPKLSPAGTSQRAQDAEPSRSDANEKLEPGMQIGPGTVLGTVQETQTIQHRIMVPSGVSGELEEVAPDGDYDLEATIARVRHQRATATGSSSTTAGPFASHAPTPSVTTVSRR